jgi:hypothetical protein
MANDYNFFSNLMDYIPNIGEKKNYFKSLLNAYSQDKITDENMIYLIQDLDSSILEKAKRYGITPTNSAVKQSLINSNCATGSDIENLLGTNDHTSLPSTIGFTDIISALGNLNNNALITDNNLATVESLSEIIGNTALGTSITLNTNNIAEKYLSPINLLAAQAVEAANTAALTPGATAGDVISNVGMFLLMNSVITAAAIASNIITAADPTLTPGITVNDLVNAILDAYAGIAATTNPADKSFIKAINNLSVTVSDTAIPGATTNDIFESVRDFIIDKLLSHEYGLPSLLGNMVSLLGSGNFSANNIHEAIAGTGQGVIGLGSSLHTSIQDTFYGIMTGAEGVAGAAATAPGATAEDVTQALESHIAANYPYVTHDTITNFTPLLLISLTIFSAITNTPDLSASDAADLATQAITPSTFDSNDAQTGISGSIGSTGKNALIIDNNAATIESISNILGDTYLGTPIGFDGSNTGISGAIGKIASAKTIIGATNAESITTLLGNSPIGIDIDSSTTTLRYYDRNTDHTGISGAIGNLANNALVYDGRASTVESISTVIGDTTLSGCKSPTTYSGSVNVGCPSGISDTDYMSTSMSKAIFNLGVCLRYAKDTYNTGILTGTINDYVSQLDTCLLGTIAANPSFAGGDGLSHNYDTHLPSYIDNAAII